VVERSGHHSRHQPTLTESPQRVEERLQLRLVLLDDTVRLVLLARHQHLAGEPQQMVTVVAQVEPSVMPAAVRRNQLC
jgi:hypothetical protein